MALALPEDRDQDGGNERAGIQMNGYSVVAIPPVAPEHRRIHEGAKSPSAFAARLAITVSRAIAGARTGDPAVGGY